MLYRGALAAALLAVIAVNPAQAQALNPKSQASTVFVGHSLINFNMPEYVGQIAASKGLSYQKAVQVIIGSPLRLNYEKCRRAGNEQSPNENYSWSCDAIDTGTSSGPYDTLVLTESNNTLALARQWNDTDGYVARYMQLMLNRNPSGRVMLFTTWEALPTYGSEWGARQAADLAAYEDVARHAMEIAASQGTSGRVEVIPVNIALRDLLARIDRGDAAGLTRSRIFLDDVHMTNVGNYFVACVVFAAIYNRSPEGALDVVPSPYSGQPALVNLSGGAGQFMQRLAWDVVSTYRSGAVLRPRPPGSLQVR
jgi:hypothetical protein